MVDFKLRPTSGLSSARWIDPESATRPTRLNIHSGISPNYYRATVGAIVVLKCTPDGEVEGAPDIDLSGRLFSWHWAEYAGPAQPTINVVPGFTSIVSFELVHVGGYLLVCSRPGEPLVPIGGGRIGIHMRRE